MLKPLHATLIHDPARLAALDAYHILDTVPEEGFDDIAQLAALACGTPVALVSLVAGDRQWFKARVSFPPCETDLNRSVCQYALAEPDLLVIPDLTADPRTATNPLVTGEPRIRFYAGAPLRTPEGQVLGSLCVIDSKPRPKGLTPPQAEHLRRCARQVMGLMNLRRAVTARDDVLARQDSELRRGRRLEVLADLSAKLLNAGQPAQVLETVLEAEAVNLGVDRSYIYETIPGQDALRLTHGVGVSDEVRAFLQRLAFGDPVCGLVAQSRQPVVLSNVQAGTDPSFQPARDDGVNAYAGYPITSHGALRGVIAFASSQTPAFDPETLDFFATVARFMSLAQERLDSEAASRENAQRVQLALSAGAIIGTWIWDIPSDRFTVDEAFANAFGLDPTLGYEGIPLAQIVATVHPDDQAGLAAAINEAVVRGGAYAHQYRVRRADGHYYWIEANGRVDHAPDGTPLSFPGVLLDIEARRTAATALLAAEERLQLALTASGAVGLWDWMVDTDLLHGDAHFARLYGLDPDRTAAGITMEQYQEFVVAEDIAPLRAAIRETFERNAPFLVEYRLAIPGQALRWIECKGQLIHDDGGQAVRFSGTAVDITERKEAEGALSASESRLSALVTAGSQSVYRMSADWQEMRALDGAGFLADTDAPSVRWLDLYIDPADRPGVLAAIEDAIQRKGTFELEHRVRRLDGTFGWTLSRAVPILNAQGEIVEWFGAASEVTERVQASQRRDALLRLGELLSDLNTKAEIAAAAAEVAGTTLGLSRAGYGSVNASREEITVEQDWRLPDLLSIAGLHTFRTYGSYIEQLKQGKTVVIRDTTQDPLTAGTAEALLQVQTRALVNLPIMERGQFVGLLFMLAPEPRDWNEPELAFMRSIADRTRAAIGRVEAEESQDILNRELSHRLKNTLAVVQSIASQTLRGVTERALVEVYEQRIIALSRAHDVLLQDNYAAAHIKTVINTVLGLLAPKDRLLIEGEDVPMGPQAALSLSLLLHELATNASKYGAWSNSVGTVMLSWHSEAGAEPTFVLEWHERGGPPALEPTSRGFGSRLIRTGLLGTRQAILRYLETGFEAEFRAPDDQVRSA